MHGTPNTEKIESKKRMLRKIISTLKNKNSKYFNCAAYFEEDTNVSSQIWQTLEFFWI